MLGKITLQPFSSSELYIFINTKKLRNIFSHRKVVNFFKFDV